MSQRYRTPPVDLADFKARKATEGAIPIVADGRTFYVRPPELMTDGEYVRMQEVKGADIVAQARLMMDDYDDFVAAGGSAVLLLGIVKEHAEARTAEQGVDPGGSVASSGSSPSTRKPSRRTSNGSTA